MANTSAIWLQAAHTIYYLLSPSCSTRALQKSVTLNKTCLRVFWREKKSQENRPLAEKRQDRKSKRTRQKNKRGDRKGESNERAKIPDKGEDLRHPRPLFAVQGKRTPMHTYRQQQ